MTEIEIQARATIAAALIVSHAVEIPRIPNRTAIMDDSAARQLRALTDYVYDTIVASDGSAPRG